MRCKDMLKALARSGLSAAVLLFAVPGPEATAADDLTGIYQLALTSDPQFLATAAENRAAHEGPVQARAALLPKLSAGTDLNLNSSDLDTAFGNTISLSLTQPVYRRDLRIALDQADTRLRQADVRYASARQDLMLRASESYFMVLRAIDELSFARAREEAFGQQLQQSRQRFDVGLIAATDVEEAKAGFDRARAAVIASENDLDTAREALRELTGEYHDVLATLGEDLPLTVPAPADIEEWTSVALRQNLVVTAAELATRLSQQEIRRREAGRLPTVDFTGQYRYNSGEQFRLHPLHGSTGSLGVAIRLPLYQGGEILSSTRESLHLHERSLEEYERAKRQAQRQTRDAFLGVKSGISRVEALEQAVRSAESAKAAIEAGFQVGTRTSVDVLNADRDLFEAKRDHAVARYAYILDVLRLKRAAGTLAEEDLSTVNAWLR